jgi:hypothetical protein
VVLNKVFSAFKIPFLAHMPKTQNVHIDESGNIRLGPPLPLPSLIDGIFEGASAVRGGNAYNNPLGNESQVPPPPTGYRTLSNIPDSQLRHSLAYADPVENGLHHGHVMNDYNGNLDEHELAGYLPNVLPAAITLRNAYVPHLEEGDMFQSCLPPPPGSAAARARPGLPRAPGGGVAPRVAPGGVDGGYLQDRQRGQNSTQSVYDSVNIVERDAMKNNHLQLGVVGLAGKSDVDKGKKDLPGGGADGRLGYARKVAAEGDRNPLEMVNPQSARVISRMAASQKAERSKRKSKTGIGIGRGGIRKKAHSK